MKLEEIGFYTLEDERAKNVCADSPMWRCEIILNDTCNFSCPYCRGLRSDCKGDMNINKVNEIIDIWGDDGLKNIRFSGGEPTMYDNLPSAICKAKSKNIERIAISTNGSANLDYYYFLHQLGVNDFSISLDACCSSFGDEMAGKKGVFDKIVNNIKVLSSITYVTVGVVLIEKTLPEVIKIINFADSLGVSDIRLLSAAQFNQVIPFLNEIPKEILDKYPILKYRVSNYLSGRNVRGIKETDCHKCHLVKDDNAVAGNFHFPCIIYLREGGNPIGQVGENMRKERMEWFEKHDSFNDLICRKNCLDVCIDYNNKVDKYQSNK